MFGKFSFLPRFIGLPSLVFALLPRILTPSNRQRRALNHYLDFMLPQTLAIKSFACIVLSDQESAHLYPWSISMKKTFEYEK